MFKGTEFFHLSPQQISILEAANAMDATLLITGSTGTGKSHLANLVHKRGNRGSTGKWYKINLATLSETLIESELFGHEQGAFTGADRRRIGRLEICNGGTVFLDEIGELSLRLQAKLLDFIQYKKITPVGSNKEIVVNVRVIAATNKNLEAAVRTGEFRSDLYHRLNVFHVRMQDLAFNPKAIVGFARRFLFEKLMDSRKDLRGFSIEVEKIFRHYNWPGNVRELENTIEYAVGMEKTNRILLSSLPNKLQEFAQSKGLILPTEELKPEQPEVEVSEQAHRDALTYLELPINLDFHESKSIFEKAYLEQALRWCGGQINLTSRKIGLNKVSLADKVKRYKIDWRKIRYEYGRDLESSN